jgi:hypothetical protein
MLCILLASVSADRYFLAPYSWVPAPEQQAGVSDLPQTYSWGWPDSSIAPAQPGFAPTWATSDVQRAAVEMANRINMKKEKRKRNRLNMLRYKKPEPRRYGPPQRTVSDPGAADFDANWNSMVFTESEAAAAAAEEAQA